MRKFWTDSAQTAKNTAIVNGNTASFFQTSYNLGVKIELKEIVQLCA